MITKDTIIGDVIKENPNAVKKFCKEHGITKMAPKSKELER